MKKSEYNRFKKTLMTQGVFDRAKIDMLSDEAKISIVNYWVRSHLPVIMDFIVPSQEQWLSSMGYGYLVHGRIFEFNCTCENQYLILDSNKKLEFT